MRAWRIRPVRVLEFVTALFVLAATFGLDFDPEQQAAILAVLAVVIGGGEAAQRKTTPLARPRDESGRMLVPTFTTPEVEAEWRRHEAEWRGRTQRRLDQDAPD